LITLYVVDYFAPPRWSMFLWCFNAMYHFSAFFYVEKPGVV